MTAAGEIARPSGTSGSRRGTPECLPAWLATPWGLAVTVAAYRLAYSLPLALASPALGMDNVADNVWDQRLQLVYQLRQPPLYDWLLWPVQRLVGPTAASFLIVKAVIMTLAALFLLGAARRAIRDRRLAALAVLSYVLLYNIGWTMLERLTQSSLLLCCCAATAWTFARALKSGRAGDHAWLGLALGAGLLAKFNFALFPLGLLAAALCSSWARRRLSPWLVLSLAVAAAATAPFVYGVASGSLPLLKSATAVMEGGARSPYPVRVGLGLTRLAVGLLEFSLPLSILALAVFWRPLRAGALDDVGETDAIARLFGLASLFCAAFAAVGVALSGADYIRDWHVLPMFVALPIWLFARVERGGTAPARLRLWAMIVLVTALGCAAVSEAGELFPDAAYCGRCETLKPYGALARDIAGMGGADATLVALDPYLAGNLRSALPSARIVMPGFAGTEGRPRRACYAVWASTSGRVPLDAALPAAGYPASSLAGSGRDRFFTYAWRPQWRSAPRASTWGVRRLDPRAAICR